MWITRSTAALVKRIFPLSTTKERAARAYAFTGAHPTALPVFFVSRLTLEGK